MTTLKKYLIFAALFAAVLGLGYANRAGGTRGEISPEAAATSSPEHIADAGKKVRESGADLSALSDAQRAWMQHLAMCESSNDPTRINKVDRDGTPSYGLFQFKPDTLIAFSRAYLTIFIDDDNVLAAIMDRSVQEATLREMILHRSAIDWSQQFPDCVKRYGPPPA